MWSVLLVLAIALTGAAYAAEPGDGRIEEQIRLAASDLGAGAPQTLVLGKKLALQDETRHSFDVEAGKTYMVAGACDEDCGALVLAAETTDGNVIDASDEDTDTPVLIFRPERNGKVSVLVTMEDCGQDACEYGVGLFSLK
jgi:hypothetical protein